MGSTPPGGHPRRWRPARRTARSWSTRRPPDRGGLPPACPSRRRRRRRPRRRRSAASRLGRHRWFLRIAETGDPTAVRRTTCLSAATRSSRASQARGRRFEPLSAAQKEAPGSARLRSRGFFLRVHRLEVMHRVMQILPLLCKWIGTSPLPSEGSMVVERRRRWSSYRPACTFSTAASQRFHISGSAVPAPGV